MNYKVNSEVKVKGTKQIVEINAAVLRDLKLATEAILNTRKLKGSSLYSSIDWIQKDNKVITLIALDYFEAVDTGRRRGIMPPVEDLIPWLKKNGIHPRKGQTLNQLAFIIANAIKRNGIVGKHYINAIIETSTEIISDDLAEIMSKNICDLIVESL